MFKIIIITLIIAIIVILVIHTKKYLTIPKEDDLQLQQMENYNHTEAEDIINKKNLLIVRKYNELNNLININIFRKLPIIKQFGSDLSFQNNIFVSYGKSNLTTSILSLNFNRNYFHIIKGSIRICLFSPNYIKQLYLTKFNQNSSISSSSINIQKPDYLLHPEFKNIQNEYIEIVLRKGNLLFIPNKWSFYIKYIEDTTILHYTFHTLISKAFSFI